MAGQQDPSRAPHEQGPGGLPRHLLTVLGAVVIAFLLVGMLRLTSRVTALELRLESMAALQPVGREGAPGPDLRVSPSEPARGENFEGAGRPSGGPPTAEAGVRRGPGRERLGDRAPSEEARPGAPRLPDAEAAEAMRLRMQERLEDYIFVAQFDEETALALQQEVDRSVAAHQANRDLIAEGKMTDVQIREFMRNELRSVVENVTEILGKDEGVLFVEEVLSVPSAELQRLFQDEREARPGLDK